MNRLRDALQTLLSPLDADHSGSWPERVNRALLEVLTSDVAIFRLSERRPAWVDPAPAAAAARAEYRLRYRPLDPWARQVTRPGQAMVQPSSRLLGPDPGRHPYHAEFLEPQHIHGYVGAQIGTTPGAHAHVGVYRIGGRRDEARTARSTGLLRSLLPALATGLRAWRASGGRGEDFARVVDRVDTAVLLWGPNGGTLHANPALSRILGAGREGERIRRAMTSFARELFRARGGDDAALAGAAPGREVRMGGSVYRLRGVMADAVVGGSGGVMLVLDGGSPEAPRGEAGAPADDASAAAGLTRRQREVAALLARGLSNREIAGALGVSENTAQTHTRKVLAALGTRSRAAVHAILHGGPGGD